MVFSAPIFLFVFLPAVLLFYYLLPRQLKNIYLLIASLVFYAWGEIFYVLIMLVSIGFNYIFGLLLDNGRAGPRKKLVLATGIAINLALLGWFKYANFLVDNINQLIAMSGAGTVDWTPVHLPLGISFFTFQAISYLVDVYREENRAQRNLVDIALYISLFPQLIAGPIVRYHDIARQLKHRVISLELVNSGMQRFIYGLAKKILIANPLGMVADQVFAISGGELTTGLAWLGIVCYTLQIYFDFSGYSDMAIGLGRMLGFRFLENFNYPYISKSIREFWRRWHISLSTWFRDYLYIPLGGSRKGTLRTYINLLIVFCLCGLWHGASWTFLVWGIFHGSFLALERSPAGRLLDRLPAVLGHVYTLFVVMAGWVFFRTESMAEALSYFQALAGQSGASGEIQYLEKFLDFKTGLLLIIGAILATPVSARLNQWFIERSQAGSGVANVRRAVIYSSSNLLLLTTLMLLCLMAIGANAYSPFIYFRF